jgi:gliding motility-associated-like protein
LGIFVLAVSVFEYRNGLLLSENKRDFQIHVLSCLPVGQPPVITHDLSGLNFSNDTIFVTANDPFCFDVDITDVNPGDTLATYTVSAPFNPGTSTPPAATFSWSGINPITGQICWTPACAYDGQIVPLIIGAYDIGDCPVAGHVFDTVWVSISVPPNSAPVITPNYAGLNISPPDTIVISATNSFCYTFTVDDLQGDSMIAYTTSPIFNSPTGPSFSWSGVSPLTGQVCWTPGCQYEGQVIPLTIGAQDFGPCNVTHQVVSNIYVQIEVPPNNPPTVSTNLAGLNFSNDTIFVFAEDNFCFDFSGLDLDLTDSLYAIGIGPIFTGPDPPTFNFTGSNPVNGQVCWTPDCQYVGQVIPMIIGVKDQGVCSNVGEDFDTVYVSISVPPNDPPVISHDLSGLNASNDTIYIAANAGFCYTFQINDPNLVDSLATFTVSPIFTTADPPAISFSGINPVTGQICWNPGCQYVGQVIELIIGTEDNARCNTFLNAFDTVYVVVELPPNDPPVSVHDLTGLNFTNDTIFVDATDTLCYDILLNDINQADTLIAFTVSPIFNDPNPPVFTYSGINPLIGQVCWIPSCAYEGLLVEIIIGVADNGDCNNILYAYDTVYVKISDPVTLPPIVTHDLTGTNHQGDTVVVWVDNDFCFDFTITDLTPGNGVLYTYEFQNFLTGANLGYGTVQTTQVGNQILGTVCFEAFCFHGGSLYRIVITGIDKATCPPFDSAKDTVFVKVNTDFFSFAGPDAGFCEGSGGAQLNATPIGGTPPYYYSWNCTNPTGCGLSNPYISNPIANPSDTTTYYVQITDAFGCTSEIDSVVVWELKLPIVDAGPDRIICEGDTGIHLFGAVLNPVEAPGPYTYLWSPSSGLNDPTLPDPYCNPDTTTIYTLVVTAISGCTSVPTTLDTLSTVTVNVNTRPNVEAGPDLHICYGDSTHLLGYADNAGPEYSFEWTPNLGLADSSDATPMASPPFTTTYFLVAWSNGCPSVADSVTLNVHTIPTADPGPILDICAGDSVQLNGIAGGDSTATYTYQWSPVDGLSDPFTAKPMASPDTTTLYTLIATSSWGCISNPYKLTVQVLPTPIANAGTDTVLCMGDSIQLKGSHSFHMNYDIGEPVFYEWSPGGGLSDIFAPQPMASPGQTLLYTLSVSSGACQTSDQLKIEVFDALRSTVTADSTIICGEDSVRLYAYAGVGSAQYSWFPTNGLSDPFIATPMASPSQSTTYHVLIQEGYCKAADSIRITVHPLPVADYFAFPDSGCAELTVSFFANSQNGLAHIWDFGDGSPVINQHDPVHTYLLPGSYPVNLTVRGEGGCTALAPPLSIYVSQGGIADFTSDPPPPASIALPEAEVRFTDLSLYAVRHLWDFGDGSTSIEKDPVHIFREAGDYNVLLIITDAVGCNDTIRIGPYRIIEPDLFIPNVFTPNGDGINDQFLIQYSGKERFNLRIFDRWGVLVYVNEGNPSKGWEGNMQSGVQASEGIYYYTLEVGEKAYNGNITLLR